MQTHLEKLQQLPPPMRTKGTRPSPHNMAVLTDAKLPPDLVDTSA